MKGFIVFEGDIIATRIIRKIEAKNDQVYIFTDDETIIHKYSSGDDGAMSYLLSVFNRREE